MLLWPTTRAMTFSGMPWSESSDTKLCRISRGVHSGASPAFFTIAWKSRRTCEASRALAVRVTKTRSASDHVRSAFLHSC